MMQAAVVEREHHDPNGLLTITDDEFARISTFIHQRFGIYLPETKKMLVQGRLNKELKNRGYRSFSDYMRDLERDEHARDLLTLVDRISTNHSFFFREPDHFEFLVDTVLREYSDAGGSPSDIRIWSAGAAEGQEAYTIAMVLREHFGERVTWKRPVILATDIAVSSLQRGVAGEYAATAIASVPPEYRKYFSEAGPDRVRVSEEIRKMVLFKRLNLNQDGYPFRNRFHTIFCRNVMIYFNKETRSDMAHRFSRYTMPNGYLMIGHSETLGREIADYRYVRPTVYKRCQ